MDNESESRPDTVYKWTVRTLYTTAFVLNLWYLMETYRDTPEAQRMVSRVERAWKKVSANRITEKVWRYSRTKMMVEAEVLLEQAAKGEEIE